MKMAGQIDHQSLLTDVHHFFQAYEVTDETELVTNHLLELIKEKELVGKKIHDANLVANMLAFNIDTILTNNVVDFSAFSHLVSIQPLQ